MRASPRHPSARPGRCPQRAHGLQVYRNAPPHDRGADVQRRTRQRSAVVEEAPKGHGGESGDSEAEPDGWTYAPVRGVPHDWDLLHFDAKFETARDPPERLWGPGIATDARAWLAGNQLSDDEVDLLDRIFLLRYHGDVLDLHRSSDIAAGAIDGEKPGTWYLNQANSPAEAFSRLR